MLNIKQGDGSQRCRHHRHLTTLQKSSIRKRCFCAKWRHLDRNDAARDHSRQKPASSATSNQSGFNFKKNHCFSQLCVTLCWTAQKVLGLSVHELGDALCTAHEEKPGNQHSASILSRSPCQGSGRPNSCVQTLKST